MMVALITYQSSYSIEAFIYPFSEAYRKTLLLGGYVYKPGVKWGDSYFETRVEGGGYVAGYIRGIDGMYVVPFLYLSTYKLSYGGIGILWDSILWFNSLGFNAHLIRDAKALPLGGGFGLFAEGKLKIPHLPFYVSIYISPTFFPESLYVARNVLNKVTLNYTSPSINTLYFAWNATFKPVNVPLSFSLWGVVKKYFVKKYFGISVSVQINEWELLRGFDTGTQKPGFLAGLSFTYYRDTSQVVEQGDSLKKGVVAEAEVKEDTTSKDTTVQTSYAKDTTVKDTTKKSKNTVASTQQCPESGILFRLAIPKSVVVYKDVYPDIGSFKRCLERKGIKLKELGNKKVKIEAPKDQYKREVFNNEIKRCGGEKYIAPKPQEDKSTKKKFVYIYKLKRGRRTEKVLTKKIISSINSEYQVYPVICGKYYIYFITGKDKYEKVKRFILEKLKRMGVPKPEEKIDECTECCICK